MKHSLLGIKVLDRLDVANGDLDVWEVQRRCAEVADPPPRPEGGRRALLLRPPPPPLNLRPDILPVDRCSAGRR